MFPQVQFIVTTHSPLLLLGVAGEYGNDGFDLVEMPQGNKVNVEAFSEFQKAYDYYTQTKAHQADLRRAIDDAVGKPLVLTEGKTDWMHMKAAKNNLGHNPELQALFANEFEFFEYDKDDMGNDKFVSLCKNCATIPQKRPLIFIADSDVNKYNKELGSEGDAAFKSHGNGVYSFVLPVPKFRENESGVCVELLYPDSILQTPIACSDGIQRRLFLSSEFDSKGRMENCYVWAGRSSKKNRKATLVIDGGSDEVFNTRDMKDDKNYAISKSAFAEHMLNQAERRLDDCFAEFKPVFERIQLAIEDYRSKESNIP